jgi:long-chain fatty acid transport protein
VNKNSFGVGLVLVFQQFEAKGLGPLSAGSQDPANFSDNGTSNSTGAGISLGWIGELSSAVSLGVTYQSEIGMSDFDDYVGLFPGGSVDIPEKYGIGLAVVASSKVDVLFDITQVNYSDTKALGNSTAGDGMSPLGASTGPGFGWDDTTVYRLGIVYKHSPSLTLRAGLNHGDNPVPNDTFNDGFFNSLTPAVTEDHLALGFTKLINSGLSITGSYVHTFEETLEGNGTGPGGAPALDLTMEQDAVGVTFSWLL